MFSKFIYFYAAVLFAALVTGCNTDRKILKGNKDSLGVDSNKKTAIIGDTVSVSPSKQNLLIISSSNRKKEIWLVNTFYKKSMNILELNQDEGLRFISWSPNEKFVAFESDNLEGHSPLTTSHVWISRTDSSSPVKVTLPSPNERFSTYNPEWKTNQLLIVAGASIEGSTQKYVYNVSTGKIEKLTSNK